MFPLEIMDARFMQQAMLGLLLLSPMTAALGVQVVNFRMAFFSDAVSHSAFAGVALGLLMGVEPGMAMLLFGLLVGLTIVVARRHSNLSSDTIIGVVFSGVIAFGIAVVSLYPRAGRSMEQFLYGDILTIGDGEIQFLFMLFAALMVFQYYSYNRLIYISINSVLAKAHGVRISLYQYLFAALLSLVVIFSVSAVGVLLVTAMLIVPAAAARGIARSAGSMFWWALAISLVSSVSGLLISAQPWAGTATGATIILIMFVWFIILTLIARLFRR